MATFYQPPPPDAGNDSPASLRMFTRQISQAVGMLFQGKSNNVLTFTCTAGAASTVLSDPRLTIGSFIDFDPLTANAAAELAAGTVYVLAANRNTGVCTITHANAGTTDRTFRLLVVG